MATSINRVAMCATIALAALSSVPAVAELPGHPRVIHFGEPVDGFQFGDAVAIRNDIAFVGRVHAWPTARVEVYGQTATGWVHTATLTVPAGTSSSGFGRAITFRDGLVVIASDTAVHVFKRSNGVWIAVQKLTPSPSFSALRYENGILAVGSSTTSGDVVYLYERDLNGKLVRRATLRASDTSPGDGFGHDVGVAGNSVVVGAPGHEAAYVFKRKSDGTWVETQKLVTAEPSAGGFGEAVAIDRGMIIVGAPGFDCEGPYFCGLTLDGHGAEGAAFGFVPVSGRYVEMFKLRPRPDEHFLYGRFGSRIAMFGKFIAITATTPFGDPDFPPYGLVFTYTRDGSIVSARGVVGGFMPPSIALANNWLLVGSSSNDPECGVGVPCYGEAILFDLNRYVE